jgi:hypothetical protein
MVGPDSVLAALWLIWLLSWLLAAGWTGTTRTRQSGLERLQHSVLIWAGAILLFARPAALGPLLLPLYPHLLGVAWSAVVLVLLGLGWTWWARMHLGRLWSATVTLKEGHALVRSGPYRVTRHPIYTGLLVAFAATAALEDSGASAIGLLLFLIGLLLKVRQEEDLLSSILGSQYAAYRAEVPALIPRLW